MGELDCRKCHADLECYNLVADSAIMFCPCCGVQVLKKQRDVLLRKASDSEIEDMVKERVLDVLDWCDSGGISASDLAYDAWECENANSVVFCSNYAADMFAMRHGRWLDDALECVDCAYGDLGHYVQMKAECNDRFLVVAFILATEHFIYDLVGIDRDEEITKKRAKELKRLVKRTPYDGGF